MLPLYRDPGFTFRFAEARVIARFRLEGVPPGCQVLVFKIDPDTGERLGLLMTGTTGADGWVDLAESLTVAAGDAFVAVPEADGP
jgi:hypothetical protein